MNKRFLSVVLCLLLALSLIFVVACGNKDDGSSDSNSSTDTGSTNTDTGSTNTGSSDTGSTNTDSNTGDTNTGDTNTGDTNTNTDTGAGEQAPAQHNVTIVLGNGEDNKTETVDHGKAPIKVPARPERYGYTFGGWTLNGEAWERGTVITSNEENIEIVAVWIANSNTLIFSSNGGSGVMDNVTIKTGEEITLPANTFAYSGYEFAGWATVNGGPVVYADGAKYVGTVDEVQALYAVWTPFKYTITYDVADGTHSNPETYSIDDVVVFTDPTREGWIFTGWECFGSPIESTEGLMGALSVVATWERPRYGITYVYDSLVDGLEVTNTNPVDINCDEVVTLVAAEVVGYDFVGWYSDAEFTTPIETLENVNAAITVYAKYEMAKFTIEYVCGEGVINSDENITEYDADTDFEFKAPTVNVVGYEFDGWYIQDTNVKLEAIIPNVYGENFVLEAKLKPIVYTITYAGLKEAPAGLPATYTVANAQNVNLPADFTVSGFVFGGWYSDASYENAISEIVFDVANPTNITVYPKLDAIKYTITYILGDKVAELEVTNTNPAEYDASDILVFAPASVEGYAFRGWYAEPTFENKVESTEGLYTNLTLYAKWGAEIEKITAAQVESFEGTTKYGTWESLFDGNCNSAGGWYVGNGWASGNAATGTLTLDDEYLISSGSLYLWSNWGNAQIEFYDAEGNLTYVYAGPDKNQVLQDLDGNEFKFYNEESFKVKKIVLNTIYSKGDRNMQFVELILNVAVEEE